MSTFPIKALRRVLDVGRRARPKGEAPQLLFIAVSTAATTVTKGFAGRDAAGSAPAYRAVRLTSRRDRRPQPEHPAPQGPRPEDAQISNPERFARFRPLDDRHTKSDETGATVNSTG
jgi:hypothetical protein